MAIVGKGLGILVVVVVVVVDFVGGGPHIRSENEEKIVSDTFLIIDIRYCDKVVSNTILMEIILNTLFKMIS